MDAGQVSKSSILDAGRTCGRILSVSGSQASVGLPLESIDPVREASITVGKFLRIQRAKSLLVGMVTEVTRRTSSAAAREQGYPRHRAPRHDGRDQAARRRQGLLPARRHRLSDDRRSRRADHARRAAADLRHLGLRHDRHRRICSRTQSIGAYINVDDMLSKHFAVLGTTGVGKSSGVALILREILEARPNLRVFLLDGHNEYAPLLRRPRAGAQSAQPEAAVLAVQFRGNRSTSSSAAAPASTRKSRSSPS